MTPSVRRVARVPMRILRWLRDSAWHTGVAVPLLALLRKAWPGTTVEADFDLVLVTPRSRDGGWILDAICRELGQRQDGLRVCYRTADQPLPSARAYFFSHYMYFFQHLSLARMMRGFRSYVFATHLEADKHGISDRAVARLLGYSHGVICMNQGLRQSFLRLGVTGAKLHVAIGGADPQTFLPHARSPQGVIGFCSAFYPRKSPELITQIVRRMPWRNFVLVGKGWHECPGFGEILALDNFRYVEPAYQAYRDYYAQMTVFVTPSRLEGGPIPLLEAMMSNVVPVASRTGFAPDIIRHGENGFLFEQDATVDQVCELIDRAYSLGSDVSSTARPYSWDAFARQVGVIMGLPGANGGAEPRDA